MKKNNVLLLTSFARNPLARKPDADTDRLIYGFKCLSKKEKEILLTILDAFLLGKRSTPQDE